MHPEIRFEFMLARDLGMTHEDLLQRVSVREFNRWRALYILESDERG